MKKLKLIAVGIVLLVSSSIQAQVSLSVNIGTAPSWGPSGYSNVDYYYLPDIEAYYDIRASQFIYFGGNNWIRSRNLPNQYRNYNLNRGYKVVLNDYHGSRPYTNFKSNKARYHKGYRGAPQRSIGYNRDHRRDNNYHKGNDYRRDHHSRRGGDDRRKGGDRDDHGKGRH
jgi:hypothetical protein